MFLSYLGGKGTDSLGKVGCCFRFLRVWGARMDGSRGPSREKNHPFLTFI